MKYKNKDKEEHYAIILEMCLKKSPLRNIRAQTMTSPVHLNKKLAFLEEVGLLESERVTVKSGEPDVRAGVHLFYVTTAKGKKYLQLYKKAVSMVKGIERLAPT